MKNEIIKEGTRRKYNWTSDNSLGGTDFVYKKLNLKGKGNWIWLYKN